MLKEFFVKLGASKVGEDEIGNRYYISSSSDYLGKKRRLVIYNGIAEPSKVPPMWHAWLHYLVDEVPLNGKNKGYEWQKPHQPNLTGTKHAYFPKGDKLGEGKRTKVSSDYEPWKPNS